MNIGEPGSGRKSGVAARRGLPDRLSRLAFALGIPMLLGFASGALAGRAEAACEKQIVARLPLVSRANHVFTTARIDGTAVTLLVDTGAAVSALDGSVAERLQVRRDGGRNAAMVGIGGGKTRPLPMLSIGRLELGPLVLSGVAMVAGDFRRGRPAAAQADGILGADVLSRYDLDIDLAAGTLALYAVAGCTGRFIDWPTATAAIPLQRFFQDQLKTAPVTVDGQPLSALVDTGATQSVLFGPAMKRLGQASRANPADGRGYGIGATGAQRVSVRLHRFASLRLGDTTIPDPLLAIARTSPLNLDMILGLDVLGGRHFWLSYATSQLFLAPP